MRARQLTWWIAGLLLLGLWSSFCLSARELHPLGVFNDDACYYLNAVAWQRGEPLPFPNYFPGQSVFLLGAVWMLGPDPGALRLVPLLPTLLTAPAIYFALRGRSQWMALSVAVLYLFTPLVVRNSTTLLSEPLFGMLAWTALAVLTARRGSRAAILAGLLLALAWQTRPTGSFVAFGVILGLVSEKRWRDAGLVLASFAALFLAFSLFRPTAGGVYVDALLGYDFLRPDYALKWLLGFLDMAGTMVFYYLPPVLIRPLAGLGLLIGIIGCVRQWSSYRLAMTCAIVFSLGHLVWPFHMARYWLLPFPIFLLGVLGAFPRRAQGAVAAGLALLCLAGDLQAVQLARLRYEQEAGRRALTGWLRRETAPDAKILTPYSAQVAMHLYPDWRRSSGGRQRPARNRRAFAWPGGATVEQPLLEVEICHGLRGGLREACGQEKLSSRDEGAACGLRPSSCQSAG
ncbi:hypothetical protein DYH09_02600 [bacterium CPR1]|nr:hypothetical protein [bacterium CPR1]